MKKYSRVRSLGEIQELAKSKGWEVDMYEFDKGDDCIWIRDLHARFKQILFNTVNGWLWIYSPESEDAIATHLSSDLDGQSWYEEILELVYVPALI